MMGQECTGRPVEILLVEDNPGDVRLAVEALKKGGMPNNLRTVGDGIAALCYLRKQGEYEGAPRPDLILLDLNLPKKGGREVLAEIKQDEDLKRIPVVVLTTSEAQEDILEVYNLHANCYVKKPSELDQFINYIKSIQDFWFDTCNLP